MCPRSQIAARANQGDLLAIFRADEYHGTRKHGGCAMKAGEEALLEQADK